MPRGFHFEPDDVEFVFIPGELHDNARAFFAEHRRDNTGPGYLCRYIDPSWDGVRIQKVLSAPVPPTPGYSVTAPTGLSPFGHTPRR